MAYEQRDNSGSLFKNDRKDKDSHPDYNGNVMIDGREYWISAWIKTGQKGKFMSLAFKPKDFAQREQRQPSSKVGDQRPAGNRNSDMDDEIPF